MTSAALISPSLDTGLAQLVAAPVTETERLASAATICDTLAVALAGAADPRASALLATLAGGPVQAPGCARGLAAVDAALWFGLCAHLLDYDDDETERAMAHLSVPCLAAALALAGDDGALLAEAYVTGCKAMLMLGAAWNPALHGAGWHPSSVLGVFGAAAAASRMLALSEAQSVEALRLAAALASGTRGAFGGMGKPLQVGQGAASGLRCAMLAARGWQGSAESLDGLAVALFGRQGRLPEEQVPEFPPQGFVTKLYPSCTATHAAIHAVLTLRAARPGAIPARIRAGLDPRALAILIPHRARTGDEGRFSLGYCLAVAAATGTVTLGAFEAAAFDDALPADPQVRALLDRIEVVEADDLPFGLSGIATGAHVKILWPDGGTDGLTVDAAPGSRALPARSEALEAKWHDCLARHAGAEAATGLLPLLRRATQPGGIADLRAALADLPQFQGKEECRIP